MKKKEPPEEPKPTLADMILIILSREEVAGLKEAVEAAIAKQQKIVRQGH